jgi:hypothetical protein
MESATIIRYATHHSGHTEYFIKVFYLGQEWATKKRFSDFVTLDGALRSNNIIIPCNLPKKNWFSKFDADFLVNRAKALQGYLDKLVLVAPLHSLIKEFLEVEKNMLNYQLKKNPSFKALRKTDRVNSIVSKTKHTYIIIDEKERLALQVRRMFLQRFALMQTPGRGGRFNSTEMGWRTTQSSFSSAVDEAVPSIGHSANGSTAVISARYAVQLDEYRSNVIQGLINCFSKKNFLLKTTQEELFTSTIQTFPDSFSEIRAILTAPFDRVQHHRTTVLDETTRIIDDRLNTRALLDDAGAPQLLADKLLFTDPPALASPPRPPSGRPRSGATRPLASSPEGEGGGSLMIKRTMADSGSNRPPGSYRPPPAQDL